MCATVTEEAKRYICPSSKISERTVTPTRGFATFVASIGYSLAVEEGDNIYTLHAVLFDISPYPLVNISVLINRYLRVRARYTSYNNSITI